MQNLVFFHQLNGMYQGQIDRNNNKHGQGVLIHDDGLTYIGNFDKDFINGEGLIIFPFGGYLLADFQNNHIQGIGVFRIQQSRILVGTFVRSQLHGIAFNYQNNKWTSAIYTNGVLIKDLNQQETVLANEIPQFLCQKQYQGQRERLERVLKANFIGDQQILKQITNNSGQVYIGIYPEGLGIYFHPHINNLKQSQGYMKDMILQGLGRIINDKQDLCDGQFNKDKLINGFKLLKSTNQFIQVQSYQNTNKTTKECITKGNQINNLLIQQHRQSIHLKSKHFIEKQNNFKGLIYIQQICIQQQAQYNNSNRMDKDRSENHIESQQAQSSLNIIRQGNYLQLLNKLNNKFFITSQEQPTKNTNKKMSHVKSMVISKAEVDVNYEKKERQERSKSSTSLLRQSLDIRSVPDELRVKIFEPINIYDFENLRQNTIFAKEGHPSKVRERKRIFSEQVRNDNFKISLYNNLQNVIMNRQ